MDDKNNNSKNKYKAKKVKSSDKVAALDAVKKKAKAKSNKDKAKNNVYYSFLTIILLICLVQITYSTVLNISKTIAYKAKVVQIEKIRDDAENKNKNLKQEIKNFSTLESLEAIARNNLKMAGEGEVLIIINDNQYEEPEQNKKKKGLFSNGNR